MTYIERLKRIFFTENDLGTKILDPEIKERMLNERIIQEGAQSLTLMSNSFFQTAVAEMYLALDSQLDSIEDTMPDADEQIRWVRLQRRALRHVCAVLDNRIAAMESLQQALQQEIDNES
jgi:hypothetical protein